MKSARLAVLVLAAAPLWGYSYYLSDNLSAIDPVKWASVGALSPGGAGLAAPDAAGGSLISRIPIPDGSAEAEVRATLHIVASGGTYTEFLQASPDARTGGAGAGSYLAFEMQNPQIDSTGRCRATFAVLQSSGGEVRLLSTFQHSCRDGMTLRMAVHGGTLLVWPDQAASMEFPIVASGVGQPGLGVYGTPAGNGFSQVQLGLIDRTAPPAIDGNQVGVSAFRNHVDVQWKPVADDANGIGLAGYWIYRDGLYFERTPATWFRDETVGVSQNHTYAVYAVDQHFNFSQAVSFTVGTPVPKAGTTVPPSPLPIPQPPPLPQEKRARRRGFAPLNVVVGTPPADSGNGIDPRRTGVRVLGSYWGAAGEQIDTASGNLNFSIPLIRAMGRGGWSVTFALSYNSQMWRQDSAGTWLMGSDVGYGLGWTLMAGSITPIWTNTGQIDHYLYTDATGAEYSLSVNTNGVWTSLEGTYVSYDMHANRIYFNDGSFWVMGSTSSSGEQDAGNLYPTLMEDSNGNQITVTYNPGSGSSYANTSARIEYIGDPRNPGAYSYYTTYTTDSIPHLSTIYNYVGTSENYTLTYASNQALNSPFNGASYGTTTELQSIGITGMNIAHNFQYDSTGTGEMTQMTTPLGGSLTWQYRTFTYSGGISVREIQSRTVNSGAGMTNSYTFQHDDAYDEAQAYHSWTQINDIGAGTCKVQSFTVPSWASMVLPGNYYETNTDGKMHYTTLNGYQQDANGNAYLYIVYTVLDGYSGGPNIWTVSQWVRDVYGNMTEKWVYDYYPYANGPGTAKWIYNYTYLTDPNYTPRYIRNRLTSATVTLNNVTTTLATKTYDGYSTTDPGGLYFHDAAYGTSFLYRGNVTTSSPDNHTYEYQVSGVVSTVMDGLNRAVSTAPSWSTNYSLPGTLTPNSNGNLATSVSYASSWAVTSVAAPNGATSTTSYDQYGRPSSSQSADGVVTTYSYTYNPNTQTATISNPPENPGGTKWKITTLDGFGRTTRVQTGHDNTTVSTVDTQYGACSCSPLGKMTAVSQPYAPGDTPVWTTYTHDGHGRTLTVTAPDGSVTTYAYSGNTTTITDPAGKWKMQTTDALGNLTTVTEPNPAGGANFVTSYTYDGMNHLSGVTLTRPEGTQTRTFNYNNGPDLMSATNPENGTLTYTYDSAHEVTSRTDALNQQTQYSYDAYGRLSEVRHYIPGGTEDANQRWDYTYDANTADSSFPANNLWGRLATVQFGGRSSSAGQMGFLYEYSYSQSGRVTNQRMQVSYMPTTANGPNGFPYPNGQAPAFNLDAAYTWDNEGRLTAWQNPAQVNTPAQFAYQFDAMGRPLALSHKYCYWVDPSSGQCSYSTANALSNAAYNAAGQPTTLLFNATNWETFTYNSNQELTQDSIAGVSNFLYYYNTGQDNGRITAVSDNIANQSVYYTYDALNRLTYAYASPGGWGQSYTFDGFGNLTGKTVTMGSGSNWSNAADPATNRLVGQSYDANGNAQFNGTSYDVENRMTARTMTQSPQYETYQYDPMGHRVSRTVSTGSSLGAQELYFWDPAGRMAAQVDCTNVAPKCGGLQQWQNYDGSNNVYFGGRQIISNGNVVVTDRLGTVRLVPAWNEKLSYLPYGEEQSSGTGPDAQFTSYLRDSVTDNQDYANQRYYNPWMGRFNSADPSNGSSAADPASWNKYTYAGDDPVNQFDPSGTDYLNANDCTSWEGDPSQQGIACGPSYYCQQFLSGLLPGGDPLLALTCLFESIPVLFAPQQAVSPLVVTSLHITADCWSPYNKKTNAPSRDTTFEAFDGSTGLAGDNIAITESVTWTSPSGPLATSLIADPNSSGIGGVFNDQKGLSSWQYGTYTVYQSFTVSVNGGPAYAVPVLFGGVLDSSLTVTLSGTYGGLINWIRGRKDYNVVVNGQGKDALPSCGSSGAQPRFH